MACARYVGRWRYKETRSGFFDHPISICELSFGYIEQSGWYCQVKFFEETI